MLAFLCFGKSEVFHRLQLHGLSFSEAIEGCKHIIIPFLPQSQSAHPSPLWQGKEQEQPCTAGAVLEWAAGCANSSCHWGHGVGWKQEAVGQGHHKTRVTQYGTPDYYPSGLPWAPHPTFYPQDHSKPLGLLILYQDSPVMVGIPNTDLSRKRNIARFSCPAHARCFAAIRKRSRPHNARCG